MMCFQGENRPSRPTRAFPIPLDSICQVPCRASRPEYRTQLRLFEFADRELIRAAAEKNLDAATLAYNQLTVSCVNCHKIVRASSK